MKQQHSRRLVARLLSWLLVTTLLLFGIDAAAATYQLVQLATLSQGSPVVAHGPNGTNVAAGGGRVIGTTGRSGLVFQSGVAPRQIFGFAGSDGTSVFGLNDVGVVVGGSNTATAVRGFSSTLAGGIRELPPLAGDTSSIAFGVNNAGQSAGFSSGPGGERAVAWDAGGTPGALPLFPRTSGSRAMGLNDRGDITGDVYTPIGRRAVIWPFGGTGTLLPLLPGGVTSESYAINARGDVVGYTGDAGGRRRATLWPAGGMVVDIGTLPGGAYSQAFGSNDVGDVVGTSSTPAGEHAFIWNRSVGLQDLNTLVAPSTFVLTKAVGINNQGVIAALGYDSADAPAGHVEAHEMPVRVFLLTR